MAEGHVVSLAVRETCIWQWSNDRNRNKVRGLRGLLGMTASEFGNMKVALRRSQRMEREVQGMLYFVSTETEDVSHC